MSEEGMKTSAADDGSPEKVELVMLHELIRAATADYVSNHPDPRHAMALLMTALPSYAGSLFATLMFMGDVNQQDTARAVKMVGANFRGGIKVGLHRAARVAERDGYMGAKQ